MIIKFRKCFCQKELAKIPQLGKWSPNWKGPFIIHKKISGNAYRLKDIDGNIKDRALNDKFLQKYQTSIWEQNDLVFQQEHAELFQTYRDY